MLKSKIFLIIAIIMLILAIIFILYALFFPEYSFPISSNILKFLYAMYFLGIILMFVLSWIFKIR